MLRTLGGLALDGGALRRPKPLLLLAYLCVEGPRDRRFLSELFWPEAADPMASLRLAITHVRAGAPGALDGTAVLRCAAACDVQLLKAALEHEALERVSELYHGPFLQGFYLKDLGVELEEWVYATREGLASRVREAMLRHAEERLATGEREAAARLAEGATWLPGAPPLDADVIARAHVLLVAGGSARARELREEARELGITLEPIAASGRNATSDAPVTSDPLLPPLPASFVGRANELSEIIALLDQDDCRLVTIVGAGGVGKTTLALQAGRQLMAGGSHAVSFVDLAVLTEAGEAPGAIADALGVTLTGARPLDELAAILRTRHAPLVLLDNFESVMPAAELVAQLLHCCPNAKFLVTSRERLDVAAEWVYRLGGLPLPLEGGAALESDAVRLFAQRARRAFPGFRAEAHLRGVLDICRLVGGSPLGIELAAAWTGDMTPDEIAREIERSLDVLTSESRDASPRHHSVRATLESSWARLREDERQASRRLAAFRGSFTPAAARVVTEATPSVLSSLVDRGLLQRDPDGRLSRHPLVVAYADEKAQEHADELGLMHARHGAYYFDLAKRELEKGHGPSESKALEAELDNLRDAWRWMAGQDDEDVLLEAAERLDQVYTMTGRYGEAEAAFASAAAHRQRGSLTWANLVALQGKHTPYLGQLEKGASLLGASLTVFRQHERTAEAAFALRHLGFVVYHDGRYEEAAAQLREGLAMAREVGDQRGVAECLNALGNVVELLGDLDEAEAMHRQALEIYTNGRDHAAVATSLVALGDVESARGRHEKARRYFEQSLRLRLEIGNTGRAAGSLARLGDVALAAGDDSEAERLYHDALALALDARGLPWVMEALLGLANLCVRRGDAERAATIAASVGAEANTTRWYRERAQAVLDGLDAGAEGYLPIAHVFDVAKGLLAERALRTGEPGEREQHPRNS